MSFLFLPKKANDAPEECAEEVDVRRVPPNIGSFLNFVTANHSDYPARLCAQSEHTIERTESYFERVFSAILALIQAVASLDEEHAFISNQHPSYSVAAAR